MYSTQGSTDDENGHVHDPLDILAHPLSPVANVGSNDENGDGFATGSSSPRSFSLSPRSRPLTLVDFAIDSLNVSQEASEDTKGNDNEASVEGDGESGDSGGELEETDQYILSEECETVSGVNSGLVGSSRLRENRFSHLDSLDYSAHSSSSANIDTGGGGVDFSADGEVDVNSSLSPSSLHSAFVPQVLTEHTLPIDMDHQKQQLQHLHEQNQSKITRDNPKEAQIPESNSKEQHLFNDQSIYQQESNSGNQIQQLQATQRLLTPLSENMNSSTKANDDEYKRNKHHIKKMLTRHTERERHFFEQLHFHSYDPSTDNGSRHSVASLNEFAGMLANIDHVLHSPSQSTEKVLQQSNASLDMKLPTVEKMKTKSPKPPFSFHCTICYEAFHPTTRPPIVLPCGHTFICEDCGKRLNKCMECRKPTKIVFLNSVASPPPPPPPAGCPPSPMSPHFSPSTPSNIAPRITSNRESASYEDSHRRISSATYSPRRFCYTSTPRRTVASPSGNIAPGATDHGSYGSSGAYHVDGTLPKGSPPPSQSLTPLPLAKNLTMIGMMEACIAQKTALCGSTEAKSSISNKDGNKSGGDVDLDSSCESEADDDFEVEDDGDPYESGDDDDQVNFGLGSMYWSGLHGTYAVKEKDGLEVLSQCPVDGLFPEFNSKKFAVAKESSDAVREIQSREQDRKSSQANHEMRSNETSRSHRSHSQGANHIFDYFINESCSYSTISDKDFKRDHNQQNDSDNLSNCGTASLAKTPLLDEVEDSYLVQCGALVQIVDLQHNVAKLARGRGYIVADSSQLVKVGAPRDELCRIEGMVHATFHRRTELLSLLQSSLKMERDLLNHLQVTAHDEYQRRLDDRLAWASAKRLQERVSSKSPVLDVNTKENNTLTESRNGEVMPYLIGMDEENEMRVEFEEEDLVITFPPDSPCEEIESIRKVKSQEECSQNSVSHKSDCPAEVEQLQRDLYQAESPPSQSSLSQSPKITPVPDLVEESATTPFPQIMPTTRGEDSVQITNEIVDSDIESQLSLGCGSFFGLEAVASSDNGPPTTPKRTNNLYHHRSASPSSHNYDSHSPPNTPLACHSFDSVDYRTGRSGHTGLSRTHKKLLANHHIPQSSTAGIVSGNSTSLIPSTPRLMSEHRGIARIRHVRNTNSSSGVAAPTSPWTPNTPTDNNTVSSASSLNNDQTWFSPFQAVTRIILGGENADESSPSQSSRENANLLTFQNEHHI